MIHFKTFSYINCENIIARYYFLYDDKNDIYYVSTQSKMTWVKKYEKISLDNCHYTFDFLTTSTVLNQNIVIEHSKHSTNVIDIIIAHNKQYKRMQKINKI